MSPEAKKFMPDKFAVKLADNRYAIEKTKMLLRRWKEGVAVYLFSESKELLCFFVAKSPEIAQDICLLIAHARGPSGRMGSRKSTFDYLDR